MSAAAGSLMHDSYAIGTAAWSARLPIMEPSNEFLELAEECDRLAQEAETERHRRILSKMAEAWRQVAKERARAYSQLNSPTSSS